MIHHTNNTLPFCSESCTAEKGFASSIIYMPSPCFFVFFFVFSFCFYRRYRRFTWAKPLRKASHLHRRGCDGDVAESRAIALVQVSLQLLTSLKPSSVHPSVCPFTHTSTQTHRNRRLSPLVEVFVSEGRNKIYKMMWLCTCAFEKEMDDVTGAPFSFKDVF